MAIRSILVPVDFSEDSVNALRYAHDFAQPFGAELLLLYVVEPIYYAISSEVSAGSVNLATLLDEQRRIGEEQLQHLRVGLEKKGQRVRTMVKAGSPAAVIADTAKRAKTDLIIMATHGRTGLAHVLMGSVAEKVVRSASCPVLTVRPGGKRTPSNRTQSQRTRTAR